MPRKRRSRACQAAAPDILSNLPENIVDLILTRLRLRDAVRTSILSKKWRNTWCRLPELTLDETNLISRNPELKFTDTETAMKTREDDRSFNNLIWPDVISHLTTLHTGPLTKFSLDICLREVSTPSMDNLMSFLSKNSLQHLFLNFLSSSYTRKQYSLPSLFFTCFRLRYLTLVSCAIQLPPLPLRGFYGLVCLELLDVTISSKMLESIIRRSPFLEQLVLRKTVMDGHVIDIYAPMLKSFDFYGSLRSICLKNVPLLAELSLGGEAKYFLKAAGDCHIAKFFKSCSALEHLELYGEFSSLEGFEVPSSLHSVKRLFIFVRYSTRVAYALCLIRSFPNLQFFDIQGTIACDNDTLVEVERYSDITFKHLMEIKYSFFEGAVYAIEFAKLLLFNSPMLERMCITIHSPLKESERVEMLDGLSKCKPASPKAEVEIILRDHKSYRVSFVYNAS